MNRHWKTGAQIVRRTFVRRAWTTTQQRWTTGSIVAGLVFASLAMPSFGIAVFGTAFAGWWLAVFITTGVFGLVGNRFGIGREKAALLRQTDRRDRID
ncbi:hypothetical protein BTE77_17250 [Ensifer adhaerens]|nr:hypothetical protein BTE77_17250 [Ensifer adhaerens]